MLKQLAQLVADEVDDRLEVELRGHALLDAVDDRELGGALLGFLQQPLRLVEQARVLERDAHARGDGAEQPHLGLAVGVLALVVLQHDRAEHAIARDDRHEHARLRRVGPANTAIPSASASARLLITSGSRRIIEPATDAVGIDRRRRHLMRTPCSYS